MKTQERKVSKLDSFKKEFKLENCELSSEKQLVVTGGNGGEEQDLIAIEDLI